MCGIAGLVGLGETGAGLREQVQRMICQLVHRGPDASGFWVSDEDGIALGHRRLSILDLSDSGAQPMHSASGRYIIVFNGEVYNFRQLKKELLGLGASFRGESDTEVMLAAFEQWGIKAAVRRFSGMFAIAVWDCDRRELVLARDRMGEKPLYYGFVSGMFLFGSELKALRACKGWVPAINRRALALYLKHNYVPSPRSIYAGIDKLLPGSCVTIRLRHGVPDVGEPETYWTLERGLEDRCVLPPMNQNDAVERLDFLLREVIDAEMVADVPLGAFLSGGTDSSCVVGIMQSISARPVKTFSIGFHEKQYNEAVFAKAVAEHLGTDHTEFYVTAEEARSVIPKLASVYDEPFSDSSQIPTCILSALTRNEVTVSLSGDGGDELFGGYNRYKWAQRLWNACGWLPVFLRRFLERGITGIAPQTWDRVAGMLYKLRGRGRQVSCVGDKLHKLAGVLSAASRYEIYDRLVSHWGSAHGLLLDQEAWPESSSAVDIQPGMEFVEWMMYQDLQTYLPDDLLVKVDRAAMAVSLETRVPLLDHKIVEFALGLPLEYKIRGGEQKWLLKQVLYRYVPEKLMRRPKMGFGVPIDSWLRGPLKEWALDLLNRDRLNREGYFSFDVIHKHLNEHLSGERNWSYYLWDVLMFESWLDAADSG